jgi:hypothetical protein
MLWTTPALAAELDCLQADLVITAGTTAALAVNAFAGLRDS